MPEQRRPLPLLTAAFSICWLHVLNYALRRKYSVFCECVFCLPAGSWRTAHAGGRWPKVKSVIEVF